MSRICALCRDVSIASLTSLALALPISAAAQEPADKPAAETPADAKKTDQDKVRETNDPADDPKATDAATPKDKPAISPGDAELLRSLEKHVTEPDADESPLARVGQRMRDVQGRLKQTDPGEETRSIQHTIVEDLDKLIEALKKGGACPQCGSANCNKHGKSQRNTSNKGQSQQASQPQQGTEPKEGQVTAKPGTLSDKQIEGNERMARAIWGHLPDKLREEMQQSFKETDLPKYRAMIERYFRAIAENAESRK